MPKRLFLFLILTMICTGGALSAAVGDVLRATVIVRSDDDEERFLGSGVAIGDAMTVVTNAHVVGSGRSVTLETWDGTALRAQVVAVDLLHDLALLRPERPLPAALQPGDAPAIGSPVFAAGAPLNTGLSLSSGIVSATDRQIDPQEPVRYLQHSAAVNPGSSGGPLVDAEGRLIGINARIADGSRFFAGIAYAVPVRDVMDFLADPQRVAPERPGLRVRAVSRSIGRALDIAPGLGVLVDYVVVSGPAGRAGVRAGDIVTRINGRAVSRPGDIALILAQGHGMETVSIRRGQDEMTLSVPAAPVPDPIAAATAQPVESHTSYRLDGIGLDLAPDGEVLAVTPGGVGFAAGLTPGDVVIAIDGGSVSGMAPGWPAALRIGRATLLLVQVSDGSTTHILLDPWAKAPKLRPASGANVLDQAVVSFE